jgi:hypothetical protein
MTKYAPDGMGKKARDIWIHYVRGNSQEGYARAKELLRKPEISVMDQAFMHLLLANDPFETGVPHTQEADRILTTGKPNLRNIKSQCTLIHFSASPSNSLVMPSRSRWT